MRFRIRIRAAARAAVVCASLAAAIVAGVADARAQQPQPPQRSRQPFAADPLSVSSDIVEAMRLLNVNPDAAVLLLHRLNARNPGRDDILSRLAYALQVADKPDSAVVYYRQAMQINPLNLEAGKSLGAILFAQGKEREAMEIFDRVIVANNHNVAAYKMVSGALRDLGRPDEAVIILERGRERAKGLPQRERARALGPLTLEIAGFYRQMGDGRRALDEYFAYAADEPRNFRFVRDQMIGVLRDAERDQEQLAAYLKTRAERGGAGAFVAADVLAAHYMERGMLESSLEMALIADADKNSDGATLLSLGEEAMARAETQPRVERGRYYDLALRALDAYVSKHPKAPNLAHARYTLAGVYTAYGSGVNAAVPLAERPAYLERAVTEYAAVSRTYPGSEYAEQAYIDRGDVLLRKLKRPKDALDAYKSGSINARRNATVYAGRIAGVYIGTGQKAEAEHYLKALMNAEYPELAQAGQYYTGIHLATQKQYDAARDTLSALAEAAPSSPFANDAIETAWTLEEAIKLGPESLDDFAAAMQADLVGDTLAAVTRLQAITARGLADPLRPRAMQRLGLIFFDAGSYDAALDVMGRFLAEYPENDQCPVVQRAIGRTYEVGLGQYAAALKAYERVLMNYPNYAMLDDARNDVQRVRAITKGNTYAP